MRLSDLSLACTDNFIKEAATQTPMTLRVKYNNPNIQQMATLAKNISLIVGHNELTPINFEMLKKKDNTLALWLLQDDYTAIVAMVLSYQNQGGMIRGSAEDFIKEYNQFNYRRHAKNLKLYNKIVFEYFWRCMARYQKNASKQLLQHGPIEHEIQKFFDEGGTKDASGMLQCFSKLNDVAGFAKYADDKELTKATNCPVFQNAWKSRLTQK